MAVDACEKASSLEFGGSYMPSPRAMAFIVVVVVVVVVVFALRAFAYLLLNPRLCPRKWIMRRRREHN